MEKPEQKRRSVEEIQENMDKYKHWLGDFPEHRIRWDKSELPLENVNEFSDAPIEFMEMAIDVLEDCYDLDIYARLFNRLSDSYLEISRLEQKLIGCAARCMVTKAALEKLGEDPAYPKSPAYPVMKVMEDLYAFVSYHFRKSHAGIRETGDRNYWLYGNLVRLELGWFELAKRLKATEERIGKIRAGKISMEELARETPEVRQSLAMNAETRKQQAQKEADPGRPVKARSFSIIRTAVPKKQQAPSEKPAEENAEPAAVPEEPPALPAPEGGIPFPVMEGIPAGLLSGDDIFHPVKLVRKKVKVKRKKRKRN